MCGYAGIIWKNGITPSDAESTLAGMEADLHHRGPDEGGAEIGKGFAVIHRRLAIIDVAQGHQPMRAAGGRIGIAYNGEIYNYKEIKCDLQRRGYSFHTDCDTEVFLALFEADGVDGFGRLDGMFTAFIWDFRQNPQGEFYLVRDHLGIKPLYIYEDTNRFVFSSELLPLLRVNGLDLEPNIDGLASYLTYRYCQAPFTLFRYIRRAEAGTYTRIKHGQASTWRFWDLPIREAACNLTLDDAAAELKRLLRKSVKQQQMSEVPVGLLLSGGLDSSVIAALCVDAGVSLKSYNIGFPYLNEFKFSEEVADRFGLPHIAVETTPAEIIGRFDRVVAAMDEPIADPACFPLHILCDHIKKDITVVLSGEGSDEMLGGYPQYMRTLESPPGPIWEKFDQFCDFSWYFVRRRLPLRRDVPPHKLWQQRQYFAERSMLNGMLAYDMKTWLPENLMAKADKILMSHSLEGRFPFLSPQIVEFVSCLPESFKISADGGKSILRRTFSSVLPQSILTRPKMGFSVPVSDIVGQMRGRLYDLLDAEKTSVLGQMLDCRALRADFDAHFAGHRDQSLWLWTVFVLLQWFNLNNSNSSALFRSTTRLSRVVSGGAAISRC